MNGINLYEPVIAERIIHKNDEHAVLVGDKETTSGAMNEFYREEVIIEKKYSWKLWAIILLDACPVGLDILFFQPRIFSQWNCQPVFYSYSTTSGNLFCS